MPLFLEDDETVTFIYEQDELNQYLRTTPEWLASLSESDIRFLRELGERVAGTGCVGPMRAYYLESVCEKLEVVHIEVYDQYFGPLVAFKDCADPDTPVVDADLLSDEILEVMASTVASVA